MHCPRDLQSINVFNKVLIRYMNQQNKQIIIVSKHTSIIFIVQINSLLILSFLIKITISIQFNNKVTISKNIMFILQQSLSSTNKQNNGQKILNQYFDAKKQKFTNFFRIFHRSIDEINQTAMQQINREIDIANKILLKISNKNQQPQINMIKDKLTPQIQNMKNRENNMLIKMTDIICKRIKENINNVQNKYIHPKIDYHSTHHGNQPYQVNSNNNNNQQIKVRHLNGRKSISKLSKSVGKQLQPSISNNNNIGISHASSSNKLVTPQKKQIKDNSYTNQQICENLDRKIQEEALELLYKQKTKSSHKRQLYSSPHPHPNKLKGSNNKLIPNSPSIGKFSMNRSHYQSKSINDNKQQLVNKKLMYENRNNINASRNQQQKYQQYRRQNAHR